MEALLRFILIVVLVYYAFKLVAKYVMPWLLTRFIKKQQEKFNNMNGFSEQNTNPNFEGKVKVKQQPKRKTRNEDDFGEYVDFEDVDK